MRFSETDEDLLRPSLSRADDVGHFGRPWNPPYLTLIGFFFGLPTAGLLFGWNYKRLGRPERQWPVIIGMTVLCVVFYLVVAYGISVDWWGQADRQSIRFANRGLTIVCSLLFARDQYPRYRLAVLSDKPLGSLWQSAVIAICVGLLIHIVILYLLVPMIDRN